VGNYKTGANYCSNYKKEIALDWTRLKRTRRINRESSTRLESTGSTKTRETKEDMEKICSRRKRRKRKDLERGEEIGKRQNKMEKLHISAMLRKEQQEMMDGWMSLDGLTAINY
jgi:hypothetical protein